MNELKFELDQDVYFLWYDEIHKGTILGRKFSEITQGPKKSYLNLTGSDWAKNTLGGDFTSLYIIYDIGESSLLSIESEKVFGSKHDLLKHLDNTWNDDSPVGLPRVEDLLSKEEE